MAVVGLVGERSGDDLPPIPPGDLAFDVTAATSLREFLRPMDPAQRYAYLVRAGIVNARPLK